MKYMPVLLVAALISGEVAGLQFVFFPIYFKNSFMLRFVCTLPIYVGIVLLTWSWIMSIMTDPGVILTNGDLTGEQISQVKSEGQAHTRRIIAIKKYLSINPEAFTKHHKKIYEEFPEEMKRLEARYSRVATMNLRMELHNAMFDNLEFSSYCNKCNVVRAPRAHHCKTCNRCY